MNDALYKSDHHECVWQERKLQKVSLAVCQKPRKGSDQMRQKFNFLNHMQSGKINWDRGGDSTLQQDNHPKCTFRDAMDGSILKQIHGLEGRYESNQESLAGPDVFRHSELCGPEKQNDKNHIFEQIQTW